MSSLKKLLKEKGYKKIKLIYTATQHLELKAKINNIEESDIKAAGAGASDMLTQIAQKNTLEIKGWKTKKVDLVLFDLRHVNDALVKHNAEKVHGIIGADVLKKGKAVIDYKSKNLYLK